MIERVNGFICLTSQDVVLAQQNINPAQPKRGPQPLGPLKPAGAVLSGPGVLSDVTA